MPTQTEQEQAKEFLKRAEIRTMKKDLSKLREDDSLKERDKIAHIKTLEEQQQEVLQRNKKQEYKAEKDIKNYATEQERQQIFLFESERFKIGKEAEKIDKEKDPALKLEKNKLLLEIRAIQAKLSSVLEQEKKLEDEQKLIIEKEQTSAIPVEKRGLEQRRSELEKQIQDIEKKRWELEKQIQGIETKITTANRSSEQLVADKNALQDKILGIDKSLREIYSAVLAREEDKKGGLLEEQKRQTGNLEKAKTAQNEKIQRQQWSHNAPETFKEKLAKSAEAEEEARKKFLQDVAQATEKEQKQNQQQSNIK